MVADSELPYPFHLKENEIVDKIVEFATSHENPSKWHSQCFHFFKSNSAHPTQDLWAASERTPRDSKISQLCNPIYHRTKERAHERIASLNPDKRYQEILERQRVEIVQYSRDLAEQASKLGRKTVNIAFVKEYMSGLRPQLLLPDAQKILHARSNFVMQGLRD